MARSPSRSTRQSGEERRAAIIQAATEEFAQHGYSGGSTEAIARRVGISQPYIFRLFGTKQALFLAVLSTVCSHLQQAFTAAARSAEHEPLQAMGAAYATLSSDRHELLLLFQAISASSEEEVQLEVRRQYWSLFEEIRRLSGASHAQMQQFFADGLLLTTATLLDLPELLSPREP